MEDIENLLDPEDLEGDTIGAKYLRMANTVSFSEMCITTIGLPASQHGMSEFKAAKMNEIRNLKDYDTFKKVQDEGHERIGS